MEKLKNRSEIPEQYKWNLESLYGEDSDWEKDFTTAEALSEKFPEFSGVLGRDAASFLEALEEKDRLWLIAERLFVYARMRKDENNRDSHYQAMVDRVQSLLARISARLSFFVPEILEIPEETIWKFADEKEGLKKYTYYLKVLLREKAHILSKPEESIIAQLSEVTGASNDIFSMINNADMKFGSLKPQQTNAFSDTKKYFRIKGSSQGTYLGTQRKKIAEQEEEIELTHGNFILFMESHDRNVRKEAFEKLYQAYRKQRNTLASTYSYNTKTDVVSARIRKYSSAIEAALSGDNIPLSVYDNLIKAVNERLGALHKYMDTRRRLLKLDELHMYDVYVPLFNLEDKPVPFESALEIMKSGLAVLGDEYISVIDDAISERWMDVYENEGKTSGAYSFGSYDSKPFILLNYKEKLKDVFTVVHEMGHSVHSWYTRRSQPFVYGGHSIFTAEVASTVNESLLIHHLLENTKDPLEKKYLLNLHIEEFRTTLFRQTMFAEFEKFTHETVEKGGALTADLLSEEYIKLNKKYFGDGVVSDEDIALEWARIPHFYRAFYVYKYATGYSAATAIAKSILEGGKAERDAYIAFLKTGESDDPIELLKIAGVDMSSPEPVLRAMEYFENLVDELAELA
jgi:oligoendopeptidase F